MHAQLSVVVGWVVTSTSQSKIQLIDCYVSQKRVKDDLPPGAWWTLIELLSVVGPLLLPETTLCPNVS